MVQDISPERWLPVVGREGRYEVSDRGQVRSLGFYINHPRAASGTVWRPGRVLRPSRHDSGHLYVGLAREPGAYASRSVHRLVLLAFEGAPPPGKPNALHWDDVPDHNAIGNLYWGDRHENSHDSVRNGNHTQARKDACPLDHLLVEPNLVPSTSRRGFRGCLACKLTQSARTHDERLRVQGRERIRYNRGRDGFRRRAGETFDQEAHRRYRHIIAVAGQLAA